MYKSHSVTRNLMLKTAVHFWHRPKYNLTNITGNNKQFIYHILFMLPIIRIASFWGTHLRIAIIEVARKRESCLSYLTFIKLVTVIENELDALVQIVVWMPPWCTSRSPWGVLNVLVVFR